MLLKDLFLLKKPEHVFPVQKTFNHIAIPIAIMQMPHNIDITYQDGRVVKALDLSSNGRKSSWVRTPLLVRILCNLRTDVCSNMLILKHMKVSAFQVSLDYSRTLVTVAACTLITASVITKLMIWNALC